MLVKRTCMWEDRDISRYSWNGAFELKPGIGLAGSTTGNHRYCASEW